MQSLSFSSSISVTKPQWRVTSSPGVTFTRRTTKSTVNAKIREIFMPAFSSTMTEGKIVSWIKSESDVLSKGESVVVVESDMDVETFYDGILDAIVVPEGESAPVGVPFGLLVESEPASGSAPAATIHSLRRYTNLQPPPAIPSSNRRRLQPPPDWIVTFPLERERRGFQVWVSRSDLREKSPNLRD
ncbi:putative dihydrolipoyllysine-residue acetyltransferase [Helianthus annuus]|nr:putative dihydrolipoyllysine-residue acetyltransferase [Helianthus annuus]